MNDGYKISNMFLDAFGLKVEAGFKPTMSSGKANDPKGLYTGIRIIEDINEAFEMSSLGTPIVFPIRFLEGTYKNYNKNGELVPVKMQTFRLPTTSVISLSRAKNIGITKINGGKGSVKEIYGFEDWNITINGFLIPDDSQPQGLTTPLQQEKELDKWDSLACSIQTGCELFTLHGFSDITISKINIEAFRGKPGVRQFTIPALSDEPIELNINGSL